MNIGVYVFLTVILLFGWGFLRRQEQREKVRQLIIAEPKIIKQKGSVPETPLGKVTYFLHNYLGMLFPSDVEISKMTTLLIRANIDSIGAEEIFALRIVLSATFGILGFVVFSASSTDYFVPLAMACALGYFGFLLPRLYVSNKADGRQKQANKELLDYIELLATATEAGLTISDAVKRVAEYSPGVLSEEFQRAWTEVYGGSTRSKAFKSLADRLDVEDIKLFIDDILQAERQGTPLSKVMKRQAKRIRDNTKIKAVENAQKASSKMLIPTIFFLLMPLLGLAMAPIFISLAQSFKF